MNQEICDLIAASKLISGSYIAQGRASLNAREKLIQTLFSNRRLPATGWDDATIEMLIAECSCMDSNNFLQSVGVGEREGRVACPLVARRHYGLSHGIGRSGDVAAEQPKAAGSSLLAKLTCLLVADALRLAGLPELSHHVTVLPVATGMAVLMTLLALQQVQTPQQRVVLWCRLDQKTCLKSILAAGYQVKVICGKLQGDQIVTDMEQLEAALQEVGPANVAAIATTSSCFAPRAADDVVAVAKLCQKLNITHIINNAYGVQSKVLCQAISSACRKGRVDAVIQSTDKNFMVPVGGAIVASPRAPSSPLNLVEGVNKLYPGRAAMAPLLDVLMTLLHWGAKGWQNVLQQREEVYQYAVAKMQGVAELLGERLLDTPGNPISLAVTLDNLTQGTPAGAQEGPLEAPTARERISATNLGSMLFHRCVSGSRVVARGKTASIGVHTFQGYGAHHDAYPHDYLALAAALGTTREAVDAFAQRFPACYKRVMADLQKGRGPP